MTDGASRIRIKKHVERMLSKLKRACPESCAVLTLSQYLRKQNGIPNYAGIITNSDPIEYQAWLNEVIVVTDRNQMNVAFDYNHDQTYSRIINGKKEAKTLLQLVRNIVRDLIERDISCPLTVGFELNEGQNITSLGENSAVSQIVNTHLKRWDWLFQKIGRRNFCKLLLDTSVFTCLPKKHGFLQISGDRIKLNNLKKADNNLHEQPIQENLGSLLSTSVEKRTVFSNSSSAYRKRELLFSTDSLTGVRNHTIPMYDLTNPRHKTEKLVQLRKTVDAKIKKFPFGRVLDDICPIDHPRPGYNKDALPISAIIQFCQTVIKRVVPYPVFGSKRNWKNIMNSVATFVRLRRPESFSLKNAFQRIKVSEIPYLGRTDKRISRPDLNKRQMSLACIIKWIFSSLLVRLLQTQFIVKEGPPNTILYYRNEMWDQICTIEIEKHKTKLIPVKTRRHVSVDNPLLSKLPVTNIGASGIRILPKPQSGYRIISRLGAHSFDCPGQPMSAETPSVNSRLTPIFHALSCETNDPVYKKHRGKGVLGSMKELPKKIINFKKSQHQSQYYAVKLDIRKAFDNIPTDLALQLAENILSGDNYWFKQYILIAAKGRKFHLQQNNAKPVSDNRSYPLTDLVSPKEDQILVEKNSTLLSNKADLVSILTEHLKENLLVIDGKYYKQTVGIPQGSSISTILCGIVYDEFEKNCISLNETSSILLRYVDDFLFISSEKKDAEKFLRTMVKGFESYGMAINPEKTLINFKPETIIGPFTVQPRTEFVGHAIDLNTLSLCQIPACSVPELAELYKYGNSFKLSGIESKLFFLASYKLSTRYIDLKLHSAGTLIQSIDATCKFLISFLAFSLKRGCIQKRYSPIRLSKLMDQLASKLSLVIHKKNDKQVLDYVGLRVGDICKERLHKYLRRKSINKLET